MDLRLGGKRTLVTGSTSGVGEAIARALAAEGASVVIHGRREEAAEGVAVSIRGSGGRAAIAPGDLDAPEGPERVVRGAFEALGGVDVLVGAAAVYPAGDFLSTPFEAWDTLYVNNAIPMVALARAFVPGMVECGWGRVVAVADIAATRPVPGVTAYTASKAAVLPTLKGRISPATVRAALKQRYAEARSPHLVRGPHAHGPDPPLQVRR